MGINATASFIFNLDLARLEKLLDYRMYNVPKWSFAANAARFLKCV